MPLPSSLVGVTGEPLTQPVDARWTMAYAAGLGLEARVFFDTTARGDVLAHPLFPVCFEWPLLIGARHLPAFDAMPPEERVRGVHASHRTRLHRPIRAGTPVTTRARAVQIEARRPGAYLVTRLDTTDETGEPLCTTWYGTLYRGVAVEGEDAVQADELPRERSSEPLPEASATLDVPIAAGAAHVYTECARIWNPIHTDAAVARAAGLPGIILHGTASLALAVSRVVEGRLGGDYETVREIGGRFGAMVAMPSTCRLHMADASDGVRFELSSQDGGPAIRDGYVGTA